jgi:HEAT repeat protein
MRKEILFYLGAYVLSVLVCTLVAIQVTWAQQTPHEGTEVRCSLISTGSVTQLATALGNRTTPARIRQATVTKLEAVARCPNEPEAQAAVDVLVQTLRNPPKGQDPSVLASVARALGRIPPDKAVSAGAVVVLLSTLQQSHSDTIVRANAAWALAEVGGNAPNVVQALINTVGVSQVNVGTTAAQSLLNMSTADVLPMLEAALNGNDVNLKWNVAWILGQMQHSPKDAVPSLTRLLGDSDEDPNVRGAAAWVLGQIGQEAAQDPTFKIIVHTLTDELTNKDNDPGIRSPSAWALGRMGDKLKSRGSGFPLIVVALTDALRDRNTHSDIRRNAAWALGQIGPETKEAVSALADALRLRKPGPDPDPRVQIEAALSLGQLGPNPDIGFPALEDAVGSNDLNVQRVACEALVKNAGALKALGKTSTVEQLRIIAAAMRNMCPDQAHSVQIDASTLAALRWTQQITTALKWVRTQYPRVTLAISAYLLLGLGWLLLFWTSPLLVFRINEALKRYSDWKPPFLGGIKVSHLIFGGFFHYRTRVLDAWVAKYVGSARHQFQKKLTVQQRAFRVEQPLVLNGEAISDLKLADLRPWFTTKRLCLLIWGEGGVGKTSLACQIANWAMSYDPTTRLSQHAMLPVLLEQGDFEGKDLTNGFIDAVIRQLEYLISDAASRDLVENLLKSRRLLLIVDGLSELDLEMRAKIQPGSPSFAARALVITSRLNEDLVGIDPCVIQPMRVRGDRLSSFMEAYLVRRGMKDRFGDTEYFDALRRLSVMVGTRDTTALLVKLYADQMIAAKEGSLEGKLAENIPDLMLEYLNELNRRPEPRKIDDFVVHRAAKAIAWECLRKTYRPTNARIEAVLKVMYSQVDVAEEKLRYLESLKLVERVGAGRDRIRFTLDPLAEYLAALYMMEEFANDEQKWRNSMDELRQIDDIEPIQGYLQAVLDCCLVKGDEFGVPGFVALELATILHFEIPKLRPERRRLARMLVERRITLSPSAPSGTTNDTATLVDLSTRGAKIRGNSRLAVEQSVSFATRDGTVVSRVVWVHEATPQQIGEAGLHFLQPCESLLAPPSPVV